jgi:hypothetical protein
MSNKTVYLCDLYGCCSEIIAPEDIYNNKKKKENDKKKICSL